MKKLIFLLVMVITGFLFVTSQAFALSFNTLIKGGSNAASDEDREYLIDRDLTNTGQLDVGDSLRGMININTLNGSSGNVGGLTPYDEFTGVFQIKLLSKSFSHIDNQTGLPFFDFVFGPDPAWVEPNSGLGGTNGVMVVLFEDATKNFAADYNDPAPAATPPADPDGPSNGPVDDGTVAGPSRPIGPPSSLDVSVGPYNSEEAFIATATDGQWWAALGYLGVPGEFSTGLGSDNVLYAFSVTSATVLGNSNFGWNQVATGPAFDPLISINRITPVPGGLVDYALSQDVRGVYDLDTAFELSSNTNISFNATIIPEPATMFLLGSGLIGMAGLARRKRKMKV